MSSQSSQISTLKLLSVLARTGLWAFFAVVVITILLLALVVLREMRLADPPLEVIVLSQLGSLAMWLMLLVAMVPIGLWILRAHANLRANRLADLAYSPGWALGSYFVPFVNLLVPMRAMRELYNRSHGEPSDFAQSEVGAVTSWWACHIAAVMVSFVMGMMALLPILTNAWFTTPPAATTALTIVNLLLWMGSALYLVQIIGRITRAQAEGAFAWRAFE